MNKLNDIQIRYATIDDCDDILNIYKYYVENTAISFEYEIPSKKEFSQRIQNTLKKYPYIVAIYNNKIIGYAYAGEFIKRKAYEKCVELTVYIDKDFTHQGIGKTLYNYLENLLKDKGIINLYACIGYPDKEDEYLTFNSVEFHKHSGFKIVGTFHKCGYKFNRWYNMVWMEKIIGKHDSL